jgi:hypothetical protein
MKAFGCDLCGRLELGTAPQTLSLKPADAPASSAYELCTTCSASFADWRTDRRGGHDGR